ncbi:MAG: dihydrodipicolinate synthase family protein [Acidobacteria bacterium]|nr:dihydrodipicolinate synthase family protein [Acidobacteriota bacterium]
MQTTFHGILPAVLTPLDAAGRLNPAVYEKLLAHLYAKGVHGIYVAGQTGEGLTLVKEDRKTLAELSMKCSPAGAQVIVHIGAARTEDAIDLAKHASRLGVTAVSSLAPPGMYSFAEIKLYYQALAAAAGVPLLVYFFPAVAPAITATEQILELCEIPNVVGLKFTDYNLYRMERIKRHGHVVYSGHDEVLAAGLLMGADGGIGTFYNVTPELFLEVYAHCKNGEHAKAMAAQQRINELIELTLRFPALSAVKRMMTWAGIPCGDPTPPRRTLTQAEEDAFASALAASSFRDEPIAQRK